MLFSSNLSQVEKYYKSCIYRESCDYYVQDRAKYFELKMQLCLVYACQDTVGRKFAKECTKK